METPNYLLKWHHCTLYWNYHTLHIIRVKIVSWQIWVYNSDFLLHLVVIVIVIHGRLSSRDVTYCRPTLSLCIVMHRCHHTSSSPVVVLYYLYTFQLSLVATSTYVDVMLCRVFLRVIIIVSCRCAFLSLSDKADHFFLSKCLNEFGIRN